ncbi:tryptophan tryptophylquinone biosynthesis enzyme MauG [Colwellia sp. 39_35_sub15_T18]|nr:tryptophan tryptophylquinone biosynthesis enzyme MauG [Colwellia sp. 39_35_sub15_T18]
MKFTLIIKLFFMLMISLKVQANQNVLKSQYKRPDSIPFPSNNQYSSTKAMLGKMLFFDPRLSKDQNLNCSSCHNPSFGWEVPLAKAVGAQAQPLPRHAPTVLNMAWVAPFFWDGRAPTLEDQALGPIESEVEMNLPIDEAIQRLNKIPGYQYWFAKAFPAESINQETILKAIATYERTIVSTQAPFDLWVNGDENAISDSAKNGFDLFNGKARCSTCHTAWNFTDNEFHDIGLLDDKDLGRYALTNQAVNKHAFKTPGLRNISQRAPYMHDGSLASLESVITHYNSGGLPRTSLSPLMSPLSLSTKEKTDLIEFLNTLTGPAMVVSLPVLPQ